MATTLQECPQFANEIDILELNMWQKHIHTSTYAHTLCTAKPVHPISCLGYGIFNRKTV